MKTTGTLVAKRIPDKGGFRRTQLFQPTQTGCRVHPIEKTKHKKISRLGSQPTPSSGVSRRPPSYVIRGTNTKRSKTDCCVSERVEVFCYQLRARPEKHRHMACKKINKCIKKKNHTLKRLTCCNSSS